MRYEDMTDEQLDREAERLSRIVGHHTVGSDAEMARVRQDQDHLARVRKARQNARQRLAAMRASAPQGDHAARAIIDDYLRRTYPQSSGPRPGVQPTAGGTMATRKPANGSQGKPGGYTPPPAGNGLASGPNPFAAVIDAMAACKSQFDPHNALAVERWFAGLTDFVDGVVDMMTGHGSKLTEDFYLDPAAGQYATGLSGVFARFQEPVAAAAATFARVHADDLEKIHNPKQHQHKWDISANRD